MRSLVPAHDFPGLNLRRSADAGLDIALDAANVEFDVDGAVGTRSGISKAGGSATLLDSSIVSLFPSRAQTGLLAVTSSTIYALGVGGASVATETPTGTVRSMVEVGTPSASAIYIADSGATIRKWSASAFSSPSGMPRASYVANAPWDNRLVAGAVTVGPGGSGPASTSTVWFSNQGDPETWDQDGAGGTPHVHLGPGDGEDITGMATWRGYVFVFKPSRFWVFYGTTEIDNVPSFDKRAVDAGVGCYPGAVVAARDGVYFVNRDGAWRTTGGTPERVSRPLDPWFRDEPLPFWSGIDPDLTQLNQSKISYARDRLYVHARGDGGFVTFVYDVPQGKWSWWGGNLTMLSSAAEVDGTVFFGRLDVEDFYLYKLEPGATEDETDSPTIPSRYRTGFYDLDTGEEKRLQGFDIWGTGDVRVRASSDFGSLDAGTAASLGASISRKRIPSKTKDGTVFSHQFGADSGRWRIHRCLLEMDGSRVAGTQS